MQPEQNQNYWQPSAEPQSDPAAPMTNETMQPAPVEVAAVPNPQTAPLSWQASEFVHHEKDGMWFLALLSVTIALLLLDIFLIQSWTFGALIIVMAIAVMVIARRPPRTITYTLSSHGIQIDDKQFNFHDFRSFGVVQENAFYSIRLVPSKRFMPMVSVFFPPENGEEIVDAFGQALPMESIERDAIDKLVEKIRF